VFAPVFALALALALALGLTAVPTAAMAAVTASLDRDQIAPGESVQLTLTHDGRTGAEPDLAPLARDFDILGRSSGSSLQIINGSVSSQSQLQLTLAPKHGGQLTIPALTWDGETTAPIALEVGGTPSPGSGQANAGASAPVFISASLAPAHPYVQQAAVLTVQVHAAQQLYQASLDLAGNADLRVQKLGKDVQSTETRGGRSFQVITRKYLLFPQRSGTLHLDGPVLDAQVQDAQATDPIFGSFQLPGMMRATRPLRLHGDPIVLDVRPRPPGLGSQPWLPATQLTLTETWKPASGPVHVGDPLTRHLSLSAVGSSAAQLPDLGAALVLPAGVKAYPDQATLDDAEQAGDLVGRREQDIALIASRPGTFTLPALHLSWWDTGQDVAREATLPARTVEVLPADGATAALPAPGAALGSASASAAAASAGFAAASAPAGAPATAPQTPAAANAGTTPWRNISFGLGGLWLATLAGWGWSWGWRRRGLGKGGASARAAARRQGKPPRQADASAAQRDVAQALRTNQAPLARSALLAWGRAEWPGDPPSGLQALGNRLGDPELSAGLRELDRACFGGSAWDGTALRQAWQALPARQGAAAGFDPLGKLYP
jgi:hypothetical protein